MKRCLAMLFALALLSLGALAAGCGGDDDGEEAGEGTTTTAEEAQKSVEIEMGDYYFKPDKLTLPAGAVEITAPNVGKVEHELVLFKTDQNPADLPVSGSTVDTEALEEEGAEEAGEVEAEAGETATGTFDVTEGKYAMICNIPGHYQKGMYGSATVK